MTTETAKQLSLVERNLTDEQIRSKAELLLKSKFLPPAIQTIEQALAIIMTGHDFGLGLMESLRSINVIQGKPCLSAQLMLALCQRTGELEDMKVEETEKDKLQGVTKCVVTVKRKGKSPHIYSFSMDDAKALKLDTKDNWIKQPKTMLRWRAISGNLRVSFADAICGLYTEDEAEDIIIHRVEAEATVQTASEEKKDAITETMITGSVHDALTESDFVLKISASFIQDQNFYFKYAERTIGEIFSDKTPGGDPKGKKFLRMVAEKSKNADDRANITKYLELMEKEPKK